MLKSKKTTEENPLKNKQPFSLKSKKQKHKRNIRISTLNHLINSLSPLIFKKIKRRTIQLSQNQKQIYQNKQIIKIIKLQ